MMDYIKEIKEIVAEQAYEQLKHNLDKVDTKELGEVIDMIKDTAEACYYTSVVEAMEKAEEEAKENGQTVYYTERYLPYYPRYTDDRLYTDGHRRVDDNSDRRYAEGGNSGRNNGNNSSRYHDVPYYDYDEPVMRDMAARRIMIRDNREGRSPQTRRMYMEAKEQHQGKEVQIQELEKYMGELSQDITEMITDATPEEKQMLHKKLAALTNKIELLNKSQGV